MKKSELDEAATCRNFRQVRKEGSRQVSREIPYYNLDMIISLGYRVKSKIEPVAGRGSISGNNKIRGENSKEKFKGRLGRATFGTCVCQMSL